MNRMVALTLVTIFSFGFSSTGLAQEIIVVVKGSSWDSDSRGFANIAGLSVQAGTEKRPAEGPGYHWMADPRFTPYLARVENLN